MIYCYSATTKTLAFADMLSVILAVPTPNKEPGQPAMQYPNVHLLESTIEPQGNTKGRLYLRAFWYILSKKPGAIKNMPAEIKADEIYVCGPVWVGQPASPIRYFLQNADLRGKKVNMLLTCLSATEMETYQKNGQKLLESIDCIPGKVGVFVAPKLKANGEPDWEIIEEHIRLVIFPEE